MPAPQVGGGSLYLIFHGNVGYVCNLESSVSLVSSIANTSSHSSLSKVLLEVCLGDCRAVIQERDTSRPISKARSCPHDHLVVYLHGLGVGKLSTLLHCV